MEIPERWTFNSPEVAKGFDAHVREQLPWYELATRGVAHLARHYIPEGGLVYDLGASTGNIGCALLPTLEERKARFYAVEPSPEMAQEYRGPGGLLVEPAETLRFEPCDLVVCFLTLQFIAYPERSQLLERIRKALRPGGAVILLDKFPPQGGYLGTALYRLTLANKLEAGATPENILKKELSLSGVQRPVQPELLEGWAAWFAYGDFRGYLWEKS